MMPSDLENTGPQKPHYEGRAKSCVVCRQFKLACDARKTAPDPCSRCVSKNLKCRFDPNFKRISTRKIAQEVADELHTLRAARHAEIQPGRFPLIVGGQSPAPYSDSHASVSSTSSISHQGPTSGPQSWIDLSDDEVVLDQTLYNVTISASRILKLFYHFDRYYYTHARFLPRLKSLNNLNSRCPLLFWTILVVAAERYEGYDGLYEQLCGIHDVLVAEVLHTAIQKLEVVHALLILCLWPVPKLRNNYDPSWNYVGLAIQAAVSLDCHTPMGKDHVMSHYKGSLDTVAAEMEPSNQAMTWLYCYQIGARLSAYLGLSPPVCSPQHSRSLNRAQKIADSILTSNEHAQIDMLDVFCSAQIHLDSISDPHAHYMMTETYEAQLNGIRMSFQEHWSWSLEVQLQSTRMYILGITFTQDLLPDDRQAHLYQQIILHKSLDVASSFISTMTAMSNQGTVAPRFWGGILTFYPKHYFTSLFQAAATVFRFLIACREPTQAQQTLAITRITEAHKIFQSFPDHRDAVRACINIEVLIQVVKNQSSQNPDMFIKHRLGASVTKDATFRAAQEKNRHPIDGSSPPVSQWATMGEGTGYQLPFAPEQKAASPNSQMWSVDSALGIWDTYSNDFGMMNEPWLGSDAEFSAMGTTQWQNPMMPVPMNQSVLYPQPDDQHHVS